MYALFLFVTVCDEFGNILELDSCHISFIYCYHPFFEVEE